MRIKDCYSFNLGLFSKYRSELMGIATLLIIICHAPIYGVQMPQWLSILLSNGGLGVDIFLFLSGMGIYNSWTSNKKKRNNLLFWLSKRYIRIIIPSILIIIPIYIWGLNQTHKSAIALNRSKWIWCSIWEKPFMVYFLHITFVYNNTITFYYFIWKKENVMVYIIIAYIFYYCLYAST